MKTFDLEITKNLTVTAEDIDDIMCSALEGGITYWCAKATPVGEYLGEWANEQIARGGELVLYDAEDDEEYVLTREKLLNGICLAYQHDYYKDYDWAVDGKIDACNVDAEVSDVIVQLALFGEVVYG